MSENAKPNLFLGLDLSTQSVKAIIVESQGPSTITCEKSVVFQSDFPQYGTTDGVYKDEEGRRVTQPVFMFVEAIDLLFKRLVDGGIDLGLVCAVSASGQQHAPIFWSKSAESLLSNLNAQSSLATQLQGAFSVEKTPIWMDSSTTDHCTSFELSVGGASALADLTGSRAHERFTAHQISKLLRDNPSLCNETSRVGLASSFVPSLLLSKIAPIDLSDGSGMNLLDLRTQRWSDKCLEACAANAQTVSADWLRHALGEPVPSHAIVGTVGQYFVNKYGLRADCAVVVSSGDNPCTLASMQLATPRHVCISLGTSDTVFGSVSQLPSSGARDPSEGHVFANPVDPSAFMLMLCFKNGSLTRQAIRDAALADLHTDSSADSWQLFDQSLSNSVPGNQGQIGFFYHFPEIVPHIPSHCIRRFGASNQPIEKFDSPQHEIRAVVEASALSAKVHMENLGVLVDVIHATGGGSKSKEILQIYSDVFGVPVWRLASGAGGAALGAALRAMHAVECAKSKAKFVSFEVITSTSPVNLVHACNPNTHNQATYQEMTTRYRDLEKTIVKSFA